MLRHLLGILNMVGALLAALRLVGIEAGQVLVTRFIGVLAVLGGVIFLGVHHGVLSPCCCRVRRGCGSSGQAAALRSNVVTKSLVTRDRLSLSHFAIASSSSSDCCSSGTMLRWVAISQRVSRDL